jgi:hypothetical protein
MITVSRPLVSAISVAVLIVASGIGCGGGSATPQNQATVTVKPGEAPDLGVMVSVEGSSREAEEFAPNVTSTLTSALSTAGYKLIEKGGKPDIEAKVKINATEEKSLFQVQVNGKVQVTYKVQLSASFVSVSENSVVDTVTSEFKSGDGSVDANAVNQLLAQLQTNGKLVAYAATLKKKAQDAEAKVQQAEDDLWKAGDVEGCKNPLTAKACDGVKAYMAKYPAGKYTADGRKAIQESEVKLARVVEEDLWKVASLEQCLKPTKSYDCKGIEEYLKKYPAGAHAEEGKKALKTSEKPLEALKKKEEASKKKASYDDCVKDCRREYADYSPGAFAILVNRCVETECK